MYQRLRKKSLSSKSLSKTSQSDALPPPSKSSATPPSLDLLLSTGFSDFRSSVILPDLGRRFSFLAREETQDVVKEKLAEQRARGGQNFITEDEEALVLQEIQLLRNEARERVVTPRFLPPPPLSAANSEWNSSSSSTGSHHNVVQLSREPSDVSSNSNTSHNVAPLSASSGRSFFGGGGGGRDLHYFRKASRSTSGRSLASTAAGSDHTPESQVSAAGSQNFGDENDPQHTVLSISPTLGLSSHPEEERVIEVVSPSDAKETQSDNYHNIPLHQPTSTAPPKGGLVLPTLKPSKRKSLLDSFSPEQMRRISTALSQIEENIMSIPTTPALDEEDEEGEESLYPQPKPLLTSHLTEGGILHPLPSTFSAVSNRDSVASSAASQDVGKENESPKPALHTRSGSLSNKEDRVSGYTPGMHRPITPRTTSSLGFNTTSSARDAASDSSRAAFLASPTQVQVSPALEVQEVEDEVVDTFTTTHINTDHRLPSFTSSHRFSDIQSEILPSPTGPLSAATTIKQLNDQHLPRVNNPPLKSLYGNTSLSINDPPQHHRIVQPSPSSLDSFDPSEVQPESSALTLTSDYGTPIGGYDSEIITESFQYIPEAGFDEEEKLEDEYNDQLPPADDINELPLRGPSLSSMANTQGHGAGAADYNWMSNGTLSSVNDSRASISSSVATPYRMKLHNHYHPSLLQLHHQHHQQQRRRSTASLDSDVSSFHGALNPTWEEDRTLSTFLDPKAAAAFNFHHQELSEDAGSERDDGSDVFEVHQHQHTSATDVENHLMSLVGLDKTALAHIQRELIQSLMPSVTIYSETRASGAEEQQEDEVAEMPLRSPRFADNVSINLSPRQYSSPGTSKAASIASKKLPSLNEDGIDPRMFNSAEATTPLSAFTPLTYSPLQESDLSKQQLPEILDDNRNSPISESNGLPVEEESEEALIRKRALAEALFGSDLEANEETHHQGVEFGDFSREEEASQDVFGQRGQQKFGRWDQGSPVATAPPPAEQRTLDRGSPRSQNVSEEILMRTPKTPKSALLQDDPHFVKNFEAKIAAATLALQNSTPPPPLNLSHKRGKSRSKSTPGISSPKLISTTANVPTTSLSPSPSTTSQVKHSGSASFKMGSRLKKLTGGFKSKATELDAGEAARSPPYTAPLPSSSNGTTANNSRFASQENVNYSFSPQEMVFSRSEPLPANYPPNFSSPTFSSEFQPQPASNPVKPRKSIISRLRKNKSDIVLASTPVRERPISPPMPQSPPYPSFAQFHNLTPDIADDHSPTWGDRETEQFSPNHPPRTPGTPGTIRAFNEDTQRSSIPSASTAADRESINQLFDAARNLGLDPDKVNKLLTRSGSLRSVRSEVPSMSRNHTVDISSPALSRSVSMRNSYVSDQYDPRSSAVSAALSQPQPGSQPSSPRQSQRKPSILRRTIILPQSEPSGPAVFRGSFASGGGSINEDRLAPLPRASMSSGRPPRSPSERSFMYKVKGGHESTNGSLFDLYNRDDAFETLNTSSSHSSFRRSSGVPNSTSQTALQILEMSSGEMVYSVVHGLRDVEDIDDDVQSIVDSIGPSSSIDEPVQVRWKGGHKRGGSVDSNLGTRPSRPARPQTKVYYSSSRQVADLIEQLSAGVDQAHIQFDGGPLESPNALSFSNSHYSPTAPSFGYQQSSSSTTHPLAGHLPLNLKSGAAPFRQQRFNSVMSTTPSQSSSSRLSVGHRIDNFLGSIMAEPATEAQIQRERF